MLLHWPAFLNWLDYYKDQHCEKRGICILGAEALPCKLCQFRELASIYWGTVDGDRTEKFTALTKLIGSEWGAPPRVQQDVAEYWPEVYRQLRNETRSFFKTDLFGLFRLSNVTVRQCHGMGACRPQYTETELDMLHVQFPDAPIKGKANTAQLGDAISEYFEQRKLPTKCGRCHNDRYDHESFRRIPECLMVHVNRIGTTAQGNLFKINNPIQIPLDLMFDASCFDPRVTIDDNVVYELTSVIMHKGEPNSGHYYIFAKGPGSKWALLDDEDVTRVDGYDAWAGRNSNQCRAYIFGFRRLAVNPTHQRIVYSDSSSEDSRVKHVQIEKQVGQNENGESEWEIADSAVSEEFDDFDEEPSAFRMKFTSGGEESMVVKANVVTEGSMENFRFPNEEGLLELSWYDQDDNVIKAFNVQGVLEQGLPSASRYRELYSETASIEAIKSTKSKDSNKSSPNKPGAKKGKAPVGAKPKGEEKKKRTRGSVAGMIEEVKQALKNENTKKGKQVKQAMPYGFF
ncbi:hypothetical protein N7466_006995 [Penicillium verhagenii]|uniref:uncharacterized protein n=1 Tax=Penicillium verhagenii TaxID=1562060 RepID=UPI002545046A|nr:uncharacterized protein N7466_006995 [Penicillium verhagenii]KAJ5928039.1 hypothetical protein N7466_006995 [Penicillium verhagenii]